jgi:hypothetical protein
VETQAGEVAVEASRHSEADSTHSAVVVVDVAAGNTFHAIILATSIS